MSLATILGAVVAPVADLGSQFLKNSKAKSQAKADYEIAVLQAKIRNADKEQELKLIDALAQNNLDKLAVQEAAQSWFDEILVCGYLSLLVITAVDPEWAKEIMAALDLLPQWYLYGVGLIGVRYLGFRRLLNKFLDRSKLPTIKMEKQ